MSQFPLMRPTLHARLDTDLTSQGLKAARGKYSLIIMPQTMQYMPDPKSVMGKYADSKAAEHYDNAEG